MNLPSSPPLYLLANAHFLLAGPVLGLVGAGMLYWREGRKGWRPVAWAVGAKALSTVALVFPLSVAFTGLLPSLLGADPLGRLPWLVLAFGGLLCLVSSILEWPFFHGVLGNGKAALAVALRANAVCLVLLVAMYLPFCSLSLLGMKCGEAIVSASDKGIEVFYLRDGALLCRGLAGPERRLEAGLVYGGDARIFARSGERGWDLWIQERDSAPRLLRHSIAPETAQAPQQLALHVKLKTSVRTVEPALAETFGKPAECVPESEGAWAIHLGEWPKDGLRVASRGLGGGYQVALDTPLLSWDVRCATRLPGERLLFQMGPYLWVLDLQTQQLRLFAKGQGAAVIRPWNESVAKFKS